MGLTIRDTVTQYFLPFTSARGGGLCNCFENRKHQAQLNGGEGAHCGADCREEATEPLGSLPSRWEVGESLNGSSPREKTEK